MGMGLTIWAMLVNRFFSSAVRLQPDRGQQVVSSGPYRLVRHPGYSGGLLLLLSAGVALGSWIAIVPILLIVPFMVRRTLIEERMLASARPGYANYMQRVPIPDRSRRVVSAQEWAAVLAPSHSPTGRPVTYSSSLHHKWRQAPITVMDAIDNSPPFPSNPSTGKSSRMRPPARSTECVMKPLLLSLAATCVIGD